MRRLIAASLEMAAELLNLAAEEVYPPPKRKPRLSKTKRSAWYDDGEKV
ncbi:MAG TPA: hypothetical protein VII58_02920 [Acidobacteriaceae bacterium]